MSNAFLTRKTGALTSLVFLVCYSAISWRRQTPTSGHWRRTAKIHSVGREQFLLLQQQHAQLRRESGQAADPKSVHRATSVTISGSGFDWHDVEFILSGRTASGVFLCRRQRDCFQ